MKQWQLVFTTEKVFRLIKEYRVDGHELWSPSKEPIEAAENLVQERFSSAFSSKN